MIKLTALTILVFINTISGAAFAANVSDVSEESFAQYGKEDAYWVVSVTCVDSDIKRVVQRKTDQDTWCPKGNDSLCSEDKNVAYTNACSAGYAEQTKKAQTVERQQRESRQAARLAAQQRKLKEKNDAEQAILYAEQKLKNKIAAEEGFLKIEQQRLDLSKRQLKVERRIAEINNLLKGEDEDL